MICFIVFSETSSLPAVTSELQQTLEGRIADYSAAISKARDAGESAKVRRYERGLKVSWDRQGVSGGEESQLSEACSSQLGEFVDRE